MNLEPRTGGKPVIIVAGQAECDLVDILKGDALSAAVSRLGASTRIETVAASAGRTDHLLQRLEGQTPDEVLSLGLPDDFVAEQFSTSLAAADVDVVILSAASDLLATHWVGGTAGSIVRRPDPDSDGWSADLTLAFEREFDQAPLLSAERYFDVTRDAVARIKRITGAHVLLLGASTLGEPRLPGYAGVQDDHRLRAHRVNAAQVRLSMTLGVSLIDVDRLVANMGGEGHVSSPLNYSPVVVNAICDEIVFVLNDIGFFENRPLVAQAGRERGR